jgi:hypothetical protein
MKVNINKQFIEGNLLTTEQKLQVIEDKIKEAQKELLEEIIKGIIAKHTLDNWNINLNGRPINEIYAGYFHISELYKLKEKIIEDIDIAVNNSQSFGRLNDEEVKEILDKRFGF